MSSLGPSLAPFWGGGLGGDKVMGLFQRGAWTGAASARDAALELEALAHARGGGL